MKIKIPDLDKNYEDLIDELVQSIPNFSADWTNFNPSDPGITLLELFSYIAECLIYRSNQVTEKTYFNFFQLIAGARQLDPLDGLQADLLDQVKKWEKNQQADFPTIRAMVERYWGYTNRAISTRDFYALAMEAYFSVDTAIPAPNINYRELTLGQLEQIRRVVVIPDEEHSAINVLLNPDPKRALDFEALRLAVKNNLITKRPIGTVINVRMVYYTSVCLYMALTISSSVAAKTVEDTIRTKIKAYLNSITGGNDHKGWPMGKSLALYELKLIAEDVEGVEEVDEVCLDPYEVVDEDDEKQLLKNLGQETATKIRHHLAFIKDPGTYLKTGSSAAESAIFLNNYIKPPLLVIVDPQNTIKIIRKKADTAKEATKARDPEGKIPFKSVFVPELVKLQDITFVCRMKQGVVDGTFGN